jgi:hypothetical protein
MISHDQPRHSVADGDPAGFPELPRASCALGAQAWWLCLATTRAILACQRDKINRSASGYDGEVAEGLLAASL